MKKVEKLNEILKKYLGIDFIQGNTEVGQTINEKIDSEKLIRLSMKEIGEKILDKKINYKSKSQTSSEKDEQLSFLDETGNLKIPNETADIEDTLKQLPVESLSYKNLGYSFEKINYYIETEEGKKEVAQYDKPVIKFTNLLSRAQFLSLIEKITGKEIDFSQLNYLSWEEVAPALSYKGFPQTWTEYNYNIYKNVKATDNTLLCKTLNFVSYDGYESDEFFPENISVYIKPLDYFKKIINPSSSIEEITLDDFLLKKIQDSIPNLVNEDEIIKRVLLIIKDEIVKKVEKYIDLLDKKSKKEAIEYDENGNLELSSDITKYINFFYIGNLCKKYNLEVPDFTTTSLEDFENTIIEIEEAKLKIFTEKRDKLEKEKQKIEKENQIKKEEFEKNKAKFTKNTSSFLEQVEDGYLQDPDFYYSDSSDTNDIFLEPERVFSLVSDIYGIISTINDFLNENNKNALEKELGDSSLIDKLNRIEKNCDYYLSINSDNFFDGDTEDNYKFTDWHELPYNHIKEVIALIKESITFINDVKNGTYDMTSTEDLEQQIRKYNTSITDVYCQIDYSVKPCLKEYNDFIKSYTNDYNVLNNIKEFLNTVNRPDIFGKDIIAKLDELLKVFKILSDKKEYKKGCQLVKSLYIK